jgi:hypothetical protein
MPSLRKHYSFNIKNLKKKGIKTGIGCPESAKKIPTDRFNWSSG